MKQFLPLLAFGSVLLTSCSSQSFLVKAEPEFHGTMNADIVIRYYTDDVNRILKPIQMEGPFLTTFRKEAVLDLAKQQAGRDLAVVIMLKFNCSDPVKLDWLNHLTQLGYKRVVFVRAVNGRKVDGLPLLSNPTELTSQPKALGQPKEGHSELAGG